MKHNWSGWPGAWCLNCGCDDPIEWALAVGDYIEVDDDSEMGWHMEFPNLDPNEECPGPLNGHNPYVK